VLTAVRMLAEAADADHSPMGAELRAMIEHVDPNLPIEIVYPGAGPVNCITETTSVHGLWWCYRHPENQPRDTLTTAIDMARDVAAQEKPLRAARPTLWRQPRSPRGLSTCSPPIIPTSTSRQPLAEWTLPGRRAQRSKSPSWLNTKSG
jgi:hypothetical protein